MAWFRMMGLDSVEYHRATVLGRDDDHVGMTVLYYGSRGETPLVWGGQLAERLGLVGAVDAAGYDAIYGPGGAHDPHLGTRLAKAKRPGVELVVAAHKTVAILGLIGRVEDMHAILDAESDATLDFLDEWFARQGGRRGKAQHRTHTSGLLWARMRHATSRAGDPAPHDHVLIAQPDRDARRPRRLEGPRHRRHPRPPARSCDPRRSGHHAEGSRARAVTHGQPATRNRSRLRLW